MNAVNVAEIEKTLRLLIDPGATFEVRALGSERDREVTLSGFFKDPSTAAQEIAHKCTNMIGVYTTLNPVRPELFYRCGGRIAKVTKKNSTTSDHHITRRKRLLIDIDGVPVAGISASEQEHQAALDLASEIEHELTQRGWPQPLRGDSGNGAHLDYAIDLPADDGGLVERVLAAAQQRFGCSLKTDHGDITLKVDVSNKNPARITKIFGTPARKGDNLPERPHRMSCIISAPDVLEVVPRDLLEAFADEYAPRTAEKQPARSPTSSGQPMQTLDAEAWLSKHGISIKSTNRQWAGRQGVGTLFELDVCPNNADHTRGEAWVLQHASGAISAGCQHQSCTWNWDWLRELHDGPKDQRRKQPPAPRQPRDEVAERRERKQAETAPDSAAKADPSDPWQQDLAKAKEEVAQALGASRLSERKPLFGLDATELLKIEFPPAPWLVSGLVTKGGTAVAAGEPKAGIKTWMLIEIAVAIATGTRAFGEFYAEHGRVAIFFAEDQAQSVRNRVRAILSGGGRMIAPGQLLLQPRGEFIDVLKDDDLAWVIASARRLGKLDLLIIDPLRDVHSGEEDKSDSMRDVMRRLRLLGEVIGCTVAVSHHVPKQTKDTASRRPGQNLRGSSAIHGSIDSGLYIQPGDSDGTSTFAAGVVSQVKNARSAGAFGLELAIVDDSNGEAIRATWVHSTEMPKGQQTPAKAAKANKDASDDEQLFRFIEEQARKGNHFTQRQLRDLISSKDLTQYRIRNSIERLIKSGKVFISEDKLRVPGVEA